MSAGQIIVAVLTVAIWAYTSWCWWRVIKLNRDTARISAETAEIWREVRDLQRQRLTHIREAK